MQKTKTAESLMAVAHTHTGILENNKIINYINKTRLNL